MAKNQIFNAFQHNYISAFDLDKTLLNCNSSLSFSRFLYKQGLFSLIDQIYALYICLSYKILHTPLDSLHTKAFNHLFKGRKETIFEEMAMQFVTKSISSMIYEPAMRRLLQAKNRGHYILLLSSSPEFLVKPIAEALSITNWKGTYYETDKTGNFQSISLLMNGQEKAKQLSCTMQTLNISQANTTAYSDSEDDLPFLQTAGIRVGVNPTKELRLLCSTHNWEILENEPY
ncbi:MAG: HAD-IB family hydrolase [Chlamydiales bacterium]|nr:HAD-IB family hydrolase [Chlamydiales bacterium]